MFSGQFYFFNSILILKIFPTFLERIRCSQFFLFQFTEDLYRFKYQLAFGYILLSKTTRLRAICCTERSFSYSTRKTILTPFKKRWEGMRKEQSNGNLFLFLYPHLLAAAKSLWSDRTARTLISASEIYIKDGTPNQGLETAP